MIGRRIWYRVDFNETSDLLSSQSDILYLISEVLDAGSSLGDVMQGVEARLLGL